MAALFAAKEADAQGIWVEAGTLTASIASELEAEGQLIANGADAADALARVVRADGRIDVEVVARSGATIVDRRVDVDRGLQPALRVVVLLIADAVSAGPADALALTESREPPTLKIRPSLWELSTGAELGLWQTNPLAGIFLGAHVSIGDFEFGGRVASTFLSSIQSSDVRGAQTAIGTLFEGEYGVWLSRVRVAWTVGVGFDFQAFSGTPHVTPSGSPILSGMSPQQPTGADTSASAWSFTGRTGPAFEFAFFGDTVVPRFAVGAMTRLPHLAVTIAGNTMDPGPIQGWAEIGLKIRFF